MFWETFYSLCIQNGVKPSQVVKACGISAGSVTKWKNGATPSGVTLQTLSAFFGVTVDELLGKKCKKEESTIFWKNLCKLCNQKSTTPTTMVNDLGIAVGNVTRWKNGSAPRYTTLKKIADYFSISVDELFGNETEKNDSTTFQENLCELCARAGITPTTLVSVLNISRGSVTHWKQGKIPHYQTQQKIADYFGISVDELLGNDTEKKESTAFWENLCELCARAGVKPTNLASAVGISCGTVTHWKQGKIPHYQTQQKIADYFDISVDELSGNNAEKEVCTFRTVDTIFRLLKAQGKSQVDLANYLGIGKNIITSWKSGRLSSYTKYLPQMAAFFGVTVDELLANPAPLEKEKAPADTPETHFMETVRGLSAEEFRELENYLNYILSKRRK